MAHRQSVMPTYGMKSNTFSPETRARTMRPKLTLVTPDYEQIVDAAQRGLKGRLMSGNKTRADRLLKRF